MESSSAFNNRPTIITNTGMGASLAWSALHANGNCYTADCHGSERSGYVYSPSSPTISIFLEGVSNPSPLVGFIQQRVDRSFEGELFSGGCWTHLSLAEADDGSTLSGSARINTKISTRACRNSLAKEYKYGALFKYELVRLK